MGRLAFLIFLLFILVNQTSPQVTTYSKLIDVNKQDDKGNTVLELDDSYLIFGTSTTFENSQLNDINLIKVNMVGDTITRESFRDSLEFSFAFMNRKSLKRISENNFGLNITRFRNDLDISNMNYFEFSDSLKLSKSKIMNSNNTRDYGTDFVKTGDGGNVLVGFRVFNQNFTSRSFYIIKTDSSLNKEWEITNFSNTASAQNVINAYDGGFIVSGVRKTSQGFVYTLLKIDNSGYTEWYKDYSGGIYSVNNSISSIAMSESDSSYVITYSIDKQTFIGVDNLLNAVIKKVDKNGNEIWSYVHNKDQYFHPIVIQSLDQQKGYVVSGLLIDDFDQSFSGEEIKTGGFILRLDNDGNLLWERRYAWYSEFYDQFLFSRLESIEPTSDGGFVCVGYAIENNERNLDIWLLKLDSLGCLDGYCGLTDTSCYYQKYPECGKSDTLSVHLALEKTVNIYPNPAKGEITVELEQFTEKLSFSLFNIKGERVLETGIHSKISKVDISQISSGHYFYTLEHQGKQFQKGRLVILE